MYLHYEDSAPEYTLKHAIGGGPVTVREALARFAVAYGSTGYELKASGLELVDADGAKFATDAVLPCGLPPNADAFVRSPAAPTPFVEGSPAATAAAAAAAAVTTAASCRAAVAQGSAPSAASVPTEELRQKGVYAKPGSAIAASQAKMGENSYYYSVGKNKPGASQPSSSVVTPAVAPVVPAPKAVVSKGAKVPEVTISSYSTSDEEKTVKVHIPLAGAGSLPDGAITCDFRERSFDLRVASDGKCLRLHIPILCEEIMATKCTVRKKPGKLIIVLYKIEDKGWYELRKTKGVGDTEYSKLTPDAGEPVKFTL